MSLCVEPGVGSAELKFGLSTTALPWTGLYWSKEMALRTLSTLSWPRTKLILVGIVSSVAGTSGLFVVFSGEGSDGSILRRHEGINEDNNASIPTNVILFKNSRRYSNLSSIYFRLSCTEANSLNTKLVL